MIAKHHAEWLSLLDISGPFLSLPVLMRVFPQGLDADDPDLAAELRAAYEEWADNQGGLRPDPAIYTAWVRFVLGRVLGIPADYLAEGQTIPAGLEAVIAEHHLTLRPDLVVGESGGSPRLLVMVYPESQDLEKPIPGSPWGAAPASRRLELLTATETRLGLATNGEHWLLVQAKRGESAGYVSWYAPLWLEERLTLRAFRSLLGVTRFFGVPDEETLPALLDQSAVDQHEVTDQLGAQVRRAVEILVGAIDAADRDRGGELLREVTETQLYEAALTVMMRLVFLLAAEERGLLLRGDPVYDQSYAVGTLGAELRAAADRHTEEVIERGYDAWPRLLATFRAVYGGINHENLRLPAYGGRLFDPDRFPFLEGRAPGSRWRETPADPLPIDNRVVLHLLDALQWLQVKVPGGAQARRLSFRALDIEQIGHVYEGLLDHHVVRATEPVLGLEGAGGKEPELSLPALEAARARGENALITFLKEHTGRSESALRRALAAPPPEGLAAGRWRAACGNDDALFGRVLPWAGLARRDDFGRPVVISPGSVYVTLGAGRRATGTHYTPRSLTEPIVQHTLEPQVYRGPAEGTPRDQWQLKTPAELLELKVCDMAVGSGAFLVQACRYLSERLVEAWDASSLVTRHSSFVTPEGRPATGDPAETIIPGDPEERLALARRLVADRCLYGVDKNPLAVEMAKLSLWLITLDKGRPFTFLDHALKHGDSLVGADEEMFLRWSQSLKGTIGPLYYEQNERAVAEARRLRRQLQAMPERDVRDAEQKARLYRESEAALARVKLGCDLLVGVELVEGLKPAEHEVWRAELLIEYTAKGSPNSEKAVRTLAAARALPALHWPFEFPEVFEKGGFDAFIGNPPFMWGNRISSNLGDEYRDWLLGLHESALGNADLCTHFFRRTHFELAKRGIVGLIATNSISETDNRTSGLEPIIKSGSTIISAQPNFPWPGNANLYVSIVIIHKGLYTGKVFLNGQHVERISSFLDPSPLDSSPRRLVEQSNLSFKGVDTGGLGFVVSVDQYEEILANRPNEASLIWPLMNGDDLLNHPTQMPSRLIINFSGLSLGEAKQYRTLIEIVEKNVLPYRSSVKRKANREKWWLFNETRPGLYAKIAVFDKALVNCVVSKYICFEFAPTRTVFTNALNVFASNSFVWFSILQSSIHEGWARYYGSTLETRNRYNPTDCFETFPMPIRYDDSRLGLIGAHYHLFRSQMLLSRNEGLTSIYNRFHDPNDFSKDIAELRELHAQMDRAVAAAYGWTDLDLAHGFHKAPQGVRFTISEAARREVLARLLRLNHERYEEEVKAGLHEKKGGAKGRKGAGGKKSKKGGGQMSLL